MKKIVCILLLFGIGTNVFGYTWNVVNKSDDDVAVTLCTTPSIEDTCKIIAIEKGQTGSIAFTAWYNAGLLLSTVEVAKNGDPSTKESFGAAGITSTDILSGGTFTIWGNSQAGYFFTG